MAQTAAQLVGPCLEKICEVASGRKYTQLRHEAKSLLSNLDEALRPVAVSADGPNALGPARAHAEPGAAAEQPAGGTVRGSASGDGDAPGSEPAAAGEAAEEAGAGRVTGDSQQVLR
jgi:hypothetical protein